MQRKSYIRTQLNLTVAMALLLSAGGSACAQMGLGLAPMRVDTSLAPSQPFTGALQLTSEAPVTTHVKGEVLDFFIDDEENPQFGSYPGLANSCRSFLRMSPREFDLESKQTQPVRYTFDAPANVKPGTYHCAAGFTTQPVPEGHQSGLAINVRVVSSFYVNVGNPSYHSQVRRLSLEPDPTDPKKGFRAFCILANVGDYMWRPVGGVDIIAANGAVREHVAIRSLPVFPKNSQRFLLPLKINPEEGETLRLSMNIGNGEIEQASATISRQMLAH